MRQGISMLEIEIEPVDYFCNHCDSAMSSTDYGYECLNCGDLTSGLYGLPWMSRRLRPITTVRLPGDRP